MNELTKEELIDLLIEVDREDMDANKPEKGGGSFFSQELRSKIGNAILPTLSRKHKELTIQNKILKGVITH